MAQPDYYKILQLDPEAEQEIVRVVYRRLSLKYHPDGSHPNAEKMRVLNEAYEVIGETARRKRYDEFRQAGGGEMWPDSRPPRAPGFWDPPAKPFDPDAAARSRRRRAYRRQGVSTWMVFGLLVFAAFGAMILQAVVGPMIQSRQAALTAPATPTVAALGLSRDLTQSELEQRGFSFAEQQQGHVWVGRNDSIGMTITISGGGDQIQSIELDMQPEEPTSQLGQDALDKQMFALDEVLSRLALDAQERVEIARWIGAVGKLTGSQATLTLDDLEIQAWSARDTHVLRVKIDPPR